MNDQKQVPVEILPDASNPKYVNSFSVASTENEVIIAFGVALPGIPRQPGPTPVEKQTIISRYITPRRGGEALARLLVRVLWGSEVEQKLPPSST